MLLWEFVRYGNLPYLHESAELIVEGVLDLDQLYLELETKGVSWVQAKLMQSYEADQEDEEGILCKAVLCYDTLIKYRAQLEQGIQGVVLLEPSRKVGICFASNLKQYSSEREYLNQLNREYRGRCYFYKTDSDRNIALVYWESPIKGKVTTLVADLKSQGYTLFNSYTEDKLREDLGL